MRYALLGMLLTLPGCMTTEEWTYVAATYPTRSEISAINAEAACKQLARNLVQVARCEVRR